MSQDKQFAGRQSHSNSRGESESTLISESPLTESAFDGEDIPGAMPPPFQLSDGSAGEGDGDGTSGGTEQKVSGPEAAEKSSAGKSLAPVFIEGNRFKIASEADEMAITEAGEAGVTVMVRLGTYAEGEVQIYWNGFGYSTVGENPYFLRVETGFLGEVFGGAAELGVELYVRDNHVSGSGILRVGGIPIAQDALEAALDSIQLPGLEGGLLSGSGAHILNSFDERGFQFMMNRLPIVTGRNFRGEISLGWVNGEPTFNGFIGLQISPEFSGELELKYTGGDFSAAGEVQFSQGPISGVLNADFRGENAQIEGKGTVATNGFRGTARILYGPESWIADEIDPVLNNLGQAETPALPEITEPSGDSDEPYRLAAYVEGSMPLGNKFEANATGVVDPVGGLTLGADIGNSDAIPLTDPLHDNFKHRIEIPGFQWRIPFVTKATIALVFEFNFGYVLSPLMIEKAKLSGVYSNSSYGAAPANSLSMSGEIGIDGKINVGGALGVKGTIDAAGNDASVELMAGINAILDAEASLTAELGIEATPEGINPNFRAEGLLAGKADLELFGQLKASVDAWGKRLDRSYEHYFGGFIVPIGEMNLGVGYDPTNESPLQFGPPEGKENIFEFNNWQEMLDGIQETDGTGPSVVGDVEMPGMDMEEAEAPMTEEQEDWLIGIKSTYRNPAGEQHRLIFEEVGDELVIMRHSTPEQLLTYCDKLIKHYAGLEGEENKSSREELENMKLILQNEEFRASVKARTPKSEVEKAGRTELAQLCNRMRKLDNRSGPLPEAPTWTKGAPYGRPEMAGFEQLHVTHGMRGQVSGTFRESPNATYKSDAMSTSWKWLRENGLNGNWIKFHIINNHLGGMANKSNLIAVPGADNTRFESEFESKLKAFYEAGEVIWMEADIEYHWRIMSGGKMPPDGIAEAFPEKFTAQGGVMRYKDGQWKRSKQPGDQIENFSLEIKLPQKMDPNQKYNVNEPGISQTNVPKNKGVWKRAAEFLNSLHSGAGADMVPYGFRDDSEDLANWLIKEGKYDRGAIDKLEWPQIDLTGYSGPGKGLIHTLIHGNIYSGQSLTRTVKHFYNLIQNKHINFE